MTYIRYKYNNLSTNSSYIQTIFILVSFYCRRTATTFYTFIYYYIHIIISQNTILAVTQLKLAALAIKTIFRVQTRRETVYNIQAKSNFILYLRESIHIYYTAADVISKINTRTYQKIGKYPILILQFWCIRA